MGTITAPPVPPPYPQAAIISSGERPYRRFVDTMRDGAAIVSESGIVLYANRSLAKMLMRPLAQLIGSPITSLLASGDVAALEQITGTNRGTTEAELITGAGETVPVRISTGALDVDEHVVNCLTFADLTLENTHNLEIGRLQTDRLRELEEAQHALTHLATHDALTGLANRTLLIDRIMYALALGERSGTFVGVIFVDLDGFKKINDTRGHATGDDVLRQVAARLRAAVRAIDSVSRLGGDEFVVLLPSMTGPEDAINVAHRIATEIDQPIKLEHGSMIVSASIGISVTAPGPVGGSHRADQLIQQADTAMYHAKSLGGAKTELYEPGTTPTVREADRETWIGRIRDGLDEDRFVLYAQPVIDLATGATVQHELLIRLRDRDGQLIPPLAFLPTAERCGLIAEIDQWVIRQAARIAALGHPVTVNLSAASSGEPLVLDAIGDELLHYQTNPGDIVFEITETAVMQNMDRGRHFAERMVALGCRFALDDFGTGFASFTYLKQLPVHYLKIDIEFVRDVVQSPRDRSVVTAIVSLARGFGQQTIAEGVENEETAGVLRSLGVTLAQGYLFGAPAPLVDGRPA